MLSCTNHFVYFGKINSSDMEYLTHIPNFWSQISIILLEVTRLLIRFIPHRVLQKYGRHLHNMKLNYELSRFIRVKILIQRKKYCHKHMSLQSSHHASDEHFKAATSGVHGVLNHRLLICLLSSFHWQRKHSNSTLLHYVHFMGGNYRWSEASNAASVYMS